jgi:hypothetical protein
MRARNIERIRDNRLAVAVVTLLRVTLAVVMSALNANYNPRSQQR